jgi:hypothetical protein
MFNVGRFAQPNFHYAFKNAVTEGAFNASTSQVRPSDEHYGFPLVHNDFPQV